MAQWVRVIAAKPGDLTLIPRTYMVKGEKKKSHKLSFDLHTYAMAWTHGLVCVVVGTHL